MDRRYRMGHRSCMDHLYRTTVTAWTTVEERRFSAA
jgi:hypothetical protein